MRKICLAILSALLLLTAACEREPRIPQQPETLIIFYTCGHDNGLSGNIENNLREILNGTRLPSLDDPTHIVLFQKHSNHLGPVLSQLGLDASGKKVERPLDWEELRNWNDESVCVSSDTLSKVLEIAHRRYPAKYNYLVFSSHASGWAPAGAFLSPDSSYIPIATSIGQDLGKDGVHVYEMELPRFAEKIPFHLNGIIFDACLMGCVETVWEMKDKCDFVGFSPTEIMAHGMYYDTMVDNLFKNDIVQVARDYMSFYRNRSYNPYGTYTVVNCAKLDTLARACKAIYEAHRSRIDNVNPDDVQHYFRDEHSWYYDLRDLAVALGPSEEELASLDAALNECVVFADHTDKFIELKIERSCGMSTYLPRTGNATLTAYYKQLKWNTATRYVE